MSEEIKVKITADTADLVGKTSKAVQQVNANLKGVDTNSVAQGFKRIGQEVTDVEKKSNSLKSTLRNISGEFGKKSLGVQLLKAGMGGGALAGVGFAAHAFEGFAEKIRDVSNEFRKGDISVTDFLGTFERTLPILGPMTKGFDALIDSVTGESAALEANNALLVSQEKNLKDVADAQEHLKKVQKEAAERKQELEDQAAIDAAPPSQKEAVKASIEARKSNKTDTDKIKEAKDRIKKIDNEYQVASGAATSKQKEVDEFRNTLPDYEGGTQKSGALDRFAAHFSDGGIKSDVNKLETLDTEQTKLEGEKVAIYQRKKAAEKELKILEDTQSHDAPLIEQHRQIESKPKGSAAIADYLRQNTTVVNNNQRIVNYAQQSPDYGRPTVLPGQYNQ